MARRNVLQEIPILVPQTERQSYEVVSEEETPAPYNKQIFCADRPHSRYISNDESKENITPSRLENILKKSQVKVLDSDSVGDLQEDEPGPSSASHATDPGAGVVSTPKRTTEGSVDDLQPCHTPMDFSTVTVGELGISSESFTTKCAGKSPKSLHKHRRRSTIGVRGSPEMNFLIRQIALQRSNRKNEPDPLDNPFTSPRNSILREKISAFRNAFQAVEETEGKLSFPGFSEVKELQPEKGEGEVRSEPPEKRKKVCVSTDPEVSSVLHKPPVTCLAQPLESSQKSVPKTTSEPDSSFASKLSTEVPSKPVDAFDPITVEVQSDETQILPSSSRSRKRKVMFTGLLSPPEPEQSLPLKLEASSEPVLKPVLKKTPRRDFVHFRVGFGEENRVLFSLQESSDNETNADINEKPEDSIKKKKRVTFGRELSPELFDKTLPANTPLRRGSTPYNYHKLDATPSEEQSVCQSPCDPMPQPDFDDKDEEETLQPLSLCFDAESLDIDSPAPYSLPEHKEESRPKEEEAAALTDGSTDNEPVKSSDETAEEIGTEVSLSDADTVNESFITSPEVSPAGTRKTRSSNKRKVTSNEETPESNGSKAAVVTKVRSTAKKARKPVISKKVQMKASRGKGKKKGGRSKKFIQKAVYSEREVVSKRPLLSPIPELPECVPTPPASTSRDCPHGKVLLNHLMKKVHIQARAGKVRENDIHFTLEDSLERNTEEISTERPVGEDVQAPVDPPLQDVKVSNNRSPERSENLPGSDVLDLAPQADPISIECPQLPTDMEVTDQSCKQATSSLAPSSEEEKKSKTKTSKRRSYTRKYASRGIETSSHCVTSEMTLEHVKQDEDADRISHKPNTSIDDPLQRTTALSSMSDELSEEKTATNYTKLPDHKKSRRSSRNHQVSNTLSANPEQDAPGEDSSAVLPHLVDHSDTSMNDFCLPIDEALQFPQQEKKVRRSMRLRRDSGVVGLTWVQENRSSETTGRRKSLSSVMRLEESSALSLDNTVHSPSKENLSSYHVPNVARRTRRRTLCTTTIQESVSTSDTKRRRSNCFYKAPNTTPVTEEVVHSTLVPDA